MRLSTFRAVARNVERVCSSSAQGVFLPREKHALRRAGPSGLSKPALSLGGRGPAVEPAVLPVSCHLTLPRLKVSGGGELHHRDAIAALAGVGGLERGDHGVGGQFLAHDLAQRAGAFAMDNPHKGHIGQVGVGKVAL